MILVEFLACALIVIGAVSMLGVLFTEKSYRCATLVMGCAQLALGIGMSTNILTSMEVLTVMVAILYMALGMFQCSLALGNRSGMPGWGMHLTSGIAAIFFSAIVWSAFPASSVYTLGIILGVNWLTNGIFRVGLGVRGRATAQSVMGSASGGSIV